MSKKDADMASKSPLVYHTHRVEEDYALDYDQPLGEGGFGSVYRCQQKGTSGGASEQSQYFACKCIRKKFVKDKSSFEAEVELQKSLDHPNICRIYDVYQDNKMYYLVMELCHGGDLFDRIIEAAHFSEHMAAILAKQMASGLFYMHSQNTAHRDLKPENFLLYEKKPVDQTALKLIDFGMSRKYTPGVPMKTRVVTPYYVSPDVLSGSYDEKCDVWSLGVVIYILLSGRPPFYGDTDQKTMSAAKKGRYTYDGEEWDGITKLAKDFIAQMLVVDPKKRIDMHAVLDHEFLKREIPKEEAVPLSKSALSNLRAFKSRDKLQRASLHLLTKWVTDDAVSNLKQMFQTMDVDGDGTLTYVEIQQGMRQSGMADAGTDLEGLLKEIDCDGSGKIDYSEFLAATIGRKQYLQEDKVWQVFKHFDFDHTGTINRDNLACILSGGDHRKFADAVGREKDEIEQIMSLHDKDGNHELDFDEFLALMKSGAMDR